TRPAHRVLLGRRRLEGGLRTVIVPVSGLRNLRSGGSGGATRSARVRGEGGVLCRGRVEEVGAGGFRQAVDGVLDLLAQLLLGAERLLAVLGQPGLRLGEDLDGE